MWNWSSAIVEEGEVCIIRGGYDPVEKIGRSDITMFRFDGSWRRSDVTLFQKCHAPGEVESALREAGFGHVDSFDSRRDLGMRGDIAVGRVFFRAQKSESSGD